MALEALPANLRRLRMERALSQAALAERAGLSRQGYRLVEGGASLPRMATVMALARALKVSSGDLVRPVASLQHVRFRSEEPLRTRAAVEARVSSWLHDYTELEDLLGARTEWSLAAAVARERDPRRVAAMARRALGLQPKDVIRDPCGLLEDQGIKVGTVPFATNRFFGLSIGPGGGGPAVVVNTWERITVERWIFTLAHELGHLLLHLDDYELAQREEDLEHEREADLFASSFLMPDEAFRKEWEEARGLDIVERVMKVKRMFRVSWRTVLHRVVEIGDESAWRRFTVDLERQTGTKLERTDEPRALSSDQFRPTPSNREPGGLDEHDFKEDRLRRLVRDAVERDVISLSRAAEILRIPLAEARALSAGWVT